MDEAELTTTATTILLGTRAYVAMQFKESRGVPEAAVKAYAALMRDGLFR